MEYPDDKRTSGYRPLTGTTHIDRQFSHHTPRYYHAVSSDYENDHVYESVGDSTISPVKKVGPFGASNATTLLQPQSIQMLSRDEKAVPVSIQYGHYTYIREDAQADWAAAELERQLNEKPPPEKTKLRTLLHEIAFVFIIAVAQALMLAGVAQALVPASIIGSSFGYDHPADLAWFSAAYALTAGTFVLPAGRLGDLFGHKKIFIIGFFWFAVWSLITGFSQQVNDNGGQGAIYFNICRAIQGIGPAMQVPNGQAMLGRAYEPGPRKALVMSLLGAAAPFGFVVGGTMASLFAELVIWSWAFWCLAAVCVFFGLLSIFVLPNSPVDKRDKRESLWIQLDATGMLLGVSGLVLFNFAWNQAALVSWSTPYTYFLLVIALMLLAVFVFAEMHAPYPLVPIAAMQSQTNFVLACTAVGWGCFSIWVFYGVQFLEVLRGWSPLVTSAALAPAPITGLIASLLVARYMMRVGPHWIMVSSRLFLYLAGLDWRGTAESSRAVYT
jgi:MFS family permease